MNLQKRLGLPYTRQGDWIKLAGSVSEAHYLLPHEQEDKDPTAVIYKDFAYQPKRDTLYEVFLLTYTSPPKLSEVFRTRIGTCATLVEAKKLAEKTLNGKI